MAIPPKQQMWAIRTKILERAVEERNVLGNEILKHASEWRPFPPDERKMTARIQSKVDVEASTETVELERRRVRVCGRTTRVHYILMTENIWQFDFVYLLPNVHLCLHVLWFSHFMRLQFLNYNSTNVENLCCAQLLIFTPHLFSNQHSLLVYYNERRLNKPD